MPKPVNYRGRKALLLAACDTTVHIVPELGGRIMQLSLGRRSYLFENRTLDGVPNVQGTPAWDGVWQNFGGEKIWPAPQGWDGEEQWPGPPDPVLDGGSYEALPVPGGVELVSPADTARTGLRIRRTVSLDAASNTVRIAARLENVSRRACRWAAWPVIQLEVPASTDEACFVTLPLAGDSAFPEGYTVLHGVANNPQFRRRGANAVVDYRYLVGKLGSDSTAGCAAYCRPSDGRVLVAEYPVTAGADYPDNTCVQVWTQGQGAFYSRGRMNLKPDDRLANPAYLEIELLSPLAHIAPGGSLHFDYALRLSTLPAGYRVESVGQEWVCGKPLQAEHCDGKIRLSGAYGFYGDGELLLTVRDGSSRTQHPIPVSALRGTEIGLTVPGGPGTGIELTLNLHNRKYLITNFTL